MITNIGKYMSFFDLASALSNIHVFLCLIFAEIGDEDAAKLVLRKCRNHPIKLMENGTEKG